MEEILLSLGIMLLVAKVFGNIAERFGVTSLVGETLAGIVLGPLLGWVFLGSFMNGLLAFGIIFLLFRAGLEVKFDEIKNHAYKASFLAIAGGLVSFFLSFLVGMFFFHDFLISMAIGTVMISTNNAALFLLLVKTGEFDSKVGRLIIAITIADDVVGILALSFFNMYVSQKIAFSSLFFIFLVSIGFYMFILTTGSKAISRVLRRISTFTDEHILFTIPIAIAFGLSYITNQIGLSVATGAFLTGMAIANSQFAEPVIEPKVNTMLKGFILPVFYASIGTLVVFSGLNIYLIIAIIVAALLGKFIGCGVISRLFGAGWNEIKLIGIAMMPRADDNIIVLQIILLLGVITHEIYTSIVFAVISTAIITPIIMRFAYKKR